MGTIYVARSAKFSEWASDVGLSKNVFKVGYTEEAPEEALKAFGAGPTTGPSSRRRPWTGPTRWS